MMKESNDRDDVADQAGNDLEIAIEESFVALDLELEQLSFLGSSSNSSTRALPTSYDEDDADGDSGMNVDNLRKELKEIKYSSFSSPEEFLDENLGNDTMVSNKRREQAGTENDNSENIDPTESDGIMLPKEAKRLLLTTNPVPSTTIGTDQSNTSFAVATGSPRLLGVNGSSSIDRPVVVYNYAIPEEAVGEVLVIGGSDSDSTFSSSEDFRNEGSSLEANVKNSRNSPFQYTKRPDPPSWNIYLRIKKSPPASNFAIDADDDGYASQLPTPEEYRASPGKRSLHASYDDQFEMDHAFMASRRGLLGRPKKCALFVCFLVLVLSVLIPILALRNKYDQVEEVMWFLVQNNISTAANLRSSDSPQNKAAKWIASTDSPRVPPSMHNDFLDRYVLAVLYFALGGDISWAHSLNFLEPGHVCNWGETFSDLEGNELVYGVTECHEIENKQVPVGLSMAFQSLRGTLPDELRFLSGLETLILQYNSHLEGEFPSSIRSLRNLQRLSLEHCSLAGTLPDWLDELTELTSLGLGDNVFSGVIPQEISSMTNLKSLGLDDNELEADLSLFGSLTNLEYLYLDSNEIGGELTASLLERWVNLRELDLSRNQISSTIPETLFSHKQLRVVDLHGNRIEGAIPELEVEANGSLKYLALHDNFLSNRIPTSIGFLVVLKHLDLSGNNLDGTLPNTLENIFNLEYLSAGDNSFSSEAFPRFLLELDMLKELSLRAINMTGTFPIEIDSLSSLRYLDLSRNKMEGTIPPSVGALADLEYLLLKDNRFSGTLPSTLSRLEKLKTVLLEQNKLEGDSDVLCTKSSTKSIEILVSDCEEPTVTCSCCTVCCSRSDTNCNILDFDSNVDLKWESGYTRAGEKEFIGAAP